MPVITPFLVQAAGPKTSTVTMPFSAGTVTIPVTFGTPMPNTNYIPTFSLGSGIALPAITITAKTVNGYTATFLALSAGTITANVIAL